jgi:peptidoglycan/xylan/chitin deacetylase (PgdA/CDA1 family)
VQISRRALLAAVATGVLAACSQPARNPGDHGFVDTPGGTGPRPNRHRRHLVVAATQAVPPPPQVPSRDAIIACYGQVRPRAWGLDVAEVTTKLNTSARLVALTFDACGGPGGSAYDERLIGILRRNQAPATLFINSRWVDANPAVFAELASDPLFEIANHGTRHCPLSVTGRSAYGILGTRDVGEVYDEVVDSHHKLTRLMGRPARFFRPGTAHFDDVAARIVRDVGECPVDFDVNGDGGATFSPDQVVDALAAVRPGSIVIAHMNHPDRGTARGIARALPQLRGNGYRLVRLSDHLLSVNPTTSNTERRGIHRSG